MHYNPSFEPRTPCSLSCDRTQSSVPLAQCQSATYISDLQEMSAPLSPYTQLLLPAPVVLNSRLGYYSNTTTGIKPINPRQPYSHTSFFYNRGPLSAGTHATSRTQADPDILVLMFAPRHLRAVVNTLNQLGAILPPHLSTGRISLVPRWHPQSRALLPSTICHRSYASQPVARTKPCCRGRVQAVIKDVKDADVVITIEESIETGNRLRNLCTSNIKINKWLRTGGDQILKTMSPEAYWKCVVLQASSIKYWEVKRRKYVTRNEERLRKFKTLATSAFRCKFGRLFCNTQ